MCRRPPWAVWVASATFGGVVVGSLLFGLAYPAVQGLYLAAPLDGVLLFDLLGVPHALLAAGVLLVAIGAFLGGEKLERIFARRNNSEAPAADPGLRNRVFGALGALAVVALITIPLGGRTEAKAAEDTAARVDALKLASMMVRDPSGLHLVDLRAPATCKHKTLPGAICLRSAEGGAAFIADLPATRTLVLFGQGSAVKLPASARRFTGRVLVLAGGFGDFERLVLRAPAAPKNPTPDALADYRLRAALHGHFTGARVRTRPTTVKPIKVKRRIRKGGGC